MRRGDFVTVAIQGDFGKPRPALVIQANQFGEHTSVTVLPITSTLVAAPLLRVTVQPSAENGLFSRFIFYFMNIRYEWKDVFAGH